MLVKAFVYDLVDRGLQEASRDAFCGAEPLSIVRDVANLFADIRLELTERGGKLSGSGANCASMRICKFAAL
jgi:hypothetical protein